MKLVGKWESVLCEAQQLSVCWRSNYTEVEEESIAPPPHTPPRGAAQLALLAHSLVLNPRMCGSPTRDATRSGGLGGAGAGEGGELQVTGTSQPAVMELAVEAVPAVAGRRSTWIPSSLLPGGHRACTSPVVTPADGGRGGAQDKERV